MHESPESPVPMPESSNAESMLESQSDSTHHGRTHHGRTHRRSGWSAGSLLFGLATAGLATAVIFWSGWPTPGEGTASASSEEGEEAASPASSDPASSGPVKVATGVCDAHRLKALKEADPSLAIEIPAEFDRQFPSANACQSAVAAWDPAAPGPKQPIPFSHKHHAGEFKIECLYCHSGTDNRRPPGFRPSSSAWAATPSSRSSTTRSRASGS